MTPKDAIIKAQKLLADLEAHGGKNTEKLRQIASLLDLALRGMEGRIQGEAVTRPARGGLTPIEYLVEMTVQGEMLTERRISGTSQPFRCSKAIYDAMVQVLAETDRPLSIEDIASTLTKHLGDRPAEFQIRVPLRLWFHVKPPLLNRIRARYRPLAATSFHADASKLWQKLAK